MTHKVPNCTDVVAQFLRERQGFTYQAPHPLPQGVVEALNRVVFLDDGEIVESSDPKVFFKQPETQRARQFLDRYLRMGVV